jgi:hypothetical protein
MQTRQMKITFVALVINRVPYVFFHFTILLANVIKMSNFEKQRPLLN